MTESLPMAIADEAKPVGPQHLPGWALSTLTRAALAVAQFEGKDLPAPHVLRQMQDELGESADPFAYRAMLPQVARLGRQGMTFEQIADRLAIPRSTFRQASMFLPDLDAAVLGGLALGVDEASQSLIDAAKGGHFKSVRFYLESKGGYRVCDEKPSVVVNIGGQPAVVGLETIETLRGGQESLLEDLEFEDVL